jgi:hypothetical protein
MSTKKNQNFSIQGANFFLNVHTPFSIINDTLKGTMLSQIVFYLNGDGIVNYDVDHLDHFNLIYQDKPITILNFREICKLHETLGLYQNDEETQVNMILNNTEIEKLIKKYPIKDVLVGRNNK